MADHSHTDPSPSRQQRFRSRPNGRTAAPEAFSGQRHVAYVTQGSVTLAPNDVSIADASGRATSGDDRYTFFLFPKPTQSDVQELAEAWGLHHVLVEDLLRGGQRPKLERYGEVLFMVVRAAHYNDQLEDVLISEFHILMRDTDIAVLCQDGRWIDGTDDFAQLAHLIEKGASNHPMLLQRPELLQLGPEAVLYQLLDAVVDGYGPVLRGVGIDKEQIESQVFSGDPKVAERIYRLSQEVIDLQHATVPLEEVLTALSKGFKRYGIPEQLRVYLQDVSDHLARAQSRTVELRESLTQILSVNATLVSQRQSEDMKKISSWAAILFAPTLIGAIYGMNFDEMPELHWQLGYPLAVGAMVALGAGLYLIFKRKKWM